MIKDESFGAVIFRKENEDILYLLLHYPPGDNYFGFSKGHSEEGEKVKETVIREVEEETGIDDLRFLPGFKEIITYSYKKEGEEILKTVTYFLAETKKKEITLSSEHDGYNWLGFKEALNVLTFQNAKEVLQKAHLFITS